MPPSALACGEVVTLQTHDSPPCACAHRAEGTPRARSCRCPAAADAAARLKDFDGAVLTSPVTAGTARGRKAWAAQSVYDNPREEIRLPLLVVSHAEDGCFRLPPSSARGIADRYGGSRSQVVVSGGMTGRGDACERRSPHGFNGMEAEVGAGIARFIRAGQY